MADKEDPQAPQSQGACDPLTSQNPPLHPNPQNPSPPHNPQIPIVPNVPQAPEAPHLPTPHVPLLNWSHFKPKYSGKPDEHAEAHLLRTNDWMDTHRFQDHVKVQRFCLTLTGVVWVWYELGLQYIFRQWYSEMGDTREQLFHAWRSFHFIKNAEMKDAYINHIKQVTTLLGYQELQILEVFRKHFWQNYIEFFFQ